MIIVREYFPNDLPMVIQAEVDDDCVVRTKVHPISTWGKVLPALILDTDDPMYAAAVQRLRRLWQRTKNN